MQNSWQAQHFGAPRSADFAADTALGEPRSAQFAAGTALCEPRSVDFVAGAALCVPRSADNFVAGAALGEPRSADFVAGTALGEPRSADFVAGAALGDQVGPRALINGALRLRCLFWRAFTNEGAEGFYLAASPTKNAAVVCRVFWYNTVGDSVSLTYGSPELWESHAGCRYAPPGRKWLQSTTYASFQFATSSGPTPRSFFFGTSPCLPSPKRTCRSPVAPVRRPRRHRPNSGSASAGTGAPPGSGRSLEAADSTTGGLHAMFATLGFEALPVFQIRGAPSSGEEQQKEPFRVTTTVIFQTR